jgi:hypothetical protein
MGGRETRRVSCESSGLSFRFVDSTSAPKRNEVLLCWAFVDHGYMGATAGHQQEDRAAQSHPS